MGAPASISIWIWLLRRAAAPTGAVMSGSSSVRPYLAKMPWSIPTQMLAILGLPPTTATSILVVPAAAAAALDAAGLAAGEPDAVGGAAAADGGEAEAAADVAETIDGDDAGAGAVAPEPQAASSIPHAIT